MIFTPEIPDDADTGSAAKKGCLSHGVQEGQPDERSGITEDQLRASTSLSP